MENFDRAQNLLQQFKGDAYLHGLGILNRVGPVTAELGRHAVLVCDRFPGSTEFVTTINESLSSAGVQVLAELKGAAPNAPREDLSQITEGLVACQPDVLVSFGGGSTIDSAKAAEVLRTLGGSIDDYFGTGLVTQALSNLGKSLSPHVAIQTAASSSAHLTKYSNITDLETGQKKLVVDNAIVPSRPVFDYRVTFGAPPTLTSDGALDGISHSLEVLYSAVGKPDYAAIEPVAVECIRLVVKTFPPCLPSHTIQKDAWP